VKNRLRRLGWGVGDQAISSVANLLLSVLLARQLGIVEFGAFGLAYAYYQIMLGVSRSTVGEPTLIRAASGPERGVGYRTAQIDTLGASLIVGLASSAVSVVIALVSPANVAPAFWALAVSLPGLMVLDGMRYWSFAVGRAKTAAMLDVGWLVGQLGLFLLIVALGVGTLFTLIASWGAGALLAAIIYLLVIRAFPSVPGGTRWFKANLDMSPRFLGEYLTVSGVQQGMVLFALIFAGISAVGSLRAAQVVMGPMNVVTMGVAVIVLPALSRRATSAPKTLMRTSVLVSAVLSGSMLAFGVLASLIPTAWGEVLLGDSWAAGQELILLAAGALAVTSLSYGATSALRAMQLVRESFKLRLITAPVVLATIGVGAWQGGAAGALIGAIVGGLLQCTAWWILYWRSWLRRVGGANA
jgi:O-antigen/teichoic acid export membrane protein